MRRVRSSRNLRGCLRAILKCDRNSPIEARSLNARCSNGDLVWRNDVSAAKTFLNDRLYDRPSGSNISADHNCFGIDAVGEIADTLTEILGRYLERLNGHFVVLVCESDQLF